MPVPGGGVARAAPAGRPAPIRGEPDPGESGERRRNADQATARLPSPGAGPIPKPSAPVMERLSQLPGFDSMPAEPVPEGDPTEMWENETLVDDDGRFDKFIQDLRHARSDEGLPVPGGGVDTAPRDQPDMDEATSVMSSMEDGITLTGDVRSPFAQPNVAVARVVSILDSNETPMTADAEAATRGHALPRPGRAQAPQPTGPGSPAQRPTVPQPSSTARSAAQRPAPPVRAAPVASSAGSAWPPPAIAPPPSRPQPPSPVVAWPAPAPPAAPAAGAIARPGPSMSGTADPFVAGSQAAVATAAYSAVDATSPARRYLVLWAIVAFLTIGVVALAVVLFSSTEEPVPTIEIVSVPAGASVALDRRALAGTTPLTLRDGLVVGQSHRVEVRLPGYAVWDTAIVASAGPVRQIAILSPLRGKLRVETEPPTAQVFVDGSYRGSTPLVLNELEATRELSLRITRPGYEPESRTVRLGDQLDQTLRLVLRPSAPR